MRNIVFFLLGFVGVGLRALSAVESGLPLRTEALQPVLLTEFDHRSYPSELEGFSGFALGRFRPGLTLTPVMYPWLRAAANIEFTGNHPPNIIDAFVRMKAASWAEFTVGYSPLPLFPSVLYEPVMRMPFPDVSPVVAAFRIERDAGVDIHILPESLPIAAWLRVSNSTIAPLANENSSLAYSGALNLVLGRARLGRTADTDFWGLRLGGAMLYKNSADRDGIYGQTAMGFVYSKPVTVDGKRLVAESHAIVYAGPLRFTVEGAFANESRSFDDDGNPLTPRKPLAAMQSYGLAAEIAWVIFGKPRGVGVQPQASNRGDGTIFDGHALELAARYDRLWLGRGAIDVRGSGGDEWGVRVRMTLFWGCPVRPLATTTCAQDS